MKRGPEELNAELLSSKDSVQNQFLPDLKDPFRYMGKWLNNKDFLSFSLGCHQTNQWTKQERDNRAASHLLELVIKGNQDEAERIAQCYPGLLLNNTCTAIDSSGKNIQGLTAFQAALCAGDIEMCVMIKEAYETFEKGKNNLKEQYDEIFPEGIEAYRQEQEKNAFDFSGIIDAILKSSEYEVTAALKKLYDNSNPLVKALCTFRNELDTLYRNEKIFNPYHVHKALDAYRDNYDSIPSRNKRDLFWRQIIGYTQRHLPACYTRDYTLKIYPFVKIETSSQAHMGLGFDFGPGPSCKLAPRGVLSRGPSLPVTRFYFDQKHQAWNDFSSSLRSSVTLGV